MKNITGILTLGAFFVGLASASAQTIIATAAAPTAGTADIVSYTEPPDQDANDYSDSTSSKGQTFTTGSSTLGYALDSVTVQGTGSAGNGYQANTYALGIYSVSGNVLTYIGGGDYTFANQSTSVDYSSDYLTFDTSSISLAPDTVYAYTIGKLDSADSGYYGFGSDSGSTPYVDVYPGGTAFYDNQIGVGSNPATTTYNNSGVTYTTALGYDQNFDIGLTAVGAAATAPEPRTWALLGMGMTGLMFLVRRRLNA